MVAGKGFFLRSTATDLDQVGAGVSTQAGQEAHRNIQANLAALQAAQPRLAAAIHEEPLAIEWVYGRDGCLTGIDVGGEFVSGCSLPRRAGQEMLRKMHASGVACYLCPAHAAQLEVALEMMGRQQAILAVMPDLREVAIALRCRDFSGDIASHRLFLAAGTEWAAELGRILEEHPGLPLPQQFVRPPTLKEDDATALVSGAQRVFSVVAQRRAELRAKLLGVGAGASASVRRVCLLSPSHFRLWDDAGVVLAEVLGGADFAEWRRVDNDDPCSSGSLALAMACQECRAVVTVNSTRAELGEALPEHVRVISWLTLPCIPRFEAGMADDALLVADSRWVGMSRAAGWPAERVAEAGWPGGSVGDVHPAPGGVGYLAIIADTFDITQTAREFEMSSHRLLWELIGQELWDDPFALGEDVEQYLKARMRRLSVQAEGLDRRLFMDELMVPAYQQGLARALTGAKIPLRFFGRGWGELGEFAASYGGMVGNRAELRSAARSAAGLVHVWPTPWAHPMDALGRAVLRRGSMGRAAYLEEARRVIKGGRGNAATGKPLTAETVRSVVC